MGDGTTPPPRKPRPKVLFAEVPADLHADVLVVSHALRMSAAAFIRRAVKRELYETRKRPLAA